MDYRKIIPNLSPEQIHRLNNLLIDEVLAEHKEFENRFKKGECYICDGSLQNIDLSHPCHHWLLNPLGLKKKHIEQFFASKPDFLGVLSYLRWVSNTEKPFQNVNNLVEEMNSAKVIEQTIVYNGIEWSFSLAPSDLQGHKGSAHTNFPHYHLQMILHGRGFISFNDLHIPLTEDDVMKITAMREIPDKLKWIIPGGEGMEEVMDENISDVVLESLKTTADEENATFNLSTFAVANPGTTIKGEDLQSIFEEHKRTGIPLAVLFKKLNATVNTIISPGQGVPELSKRNPRKKKR